MGLGLFPRLEERLHQRVGSVSASDQQMPAIGRALMTELRLSRIDGVAPGLMPKMVDACYEAIAAPESKGLTILLAEQSTDRALEVAGQACVLESGRAVYQAPRGQGAIRT